MDAPAPKFPNSLRAFREAAKLSQPQLAALVDTNVQNVSRIERGERELSRKWAARFAPALGTTAENLLFSRPTDAPSAKSSVRRGPDVEGFAPADLARLPIRGEVAAGRWLETPALLQLSEITDFVEGLAIPPSQAEWTYGLRVRGTSLNKLAVENDILVCLDAMSGIEFAHRDLVIVERVRDQGALREVTAKRLIRRDGRFHLMPESTDPMWQNEIEIGEDVPQDDAEIRFIAKVKHIIKPVG